MKLVNVIMFMIVIQAVIMMYDQVFTPTYDLTGYSSNETMIWNFVANPSGWSGTDLLGIFVGLTAVGGLIGVGVYLVTKSDTALFFPVFTLLLGIGAVPIASLYSVFTRDPAFFGCVVGEVCPLSIYAWIFTGGLLAIFYVLACLQWWSGRDTG